MVRSSCSHKAPLLMEGKEMPPSPLPYKTSLRFIRGVWVKHPPLATPPSLMPQLWAIYGQLIHLSPLLPHTFPPWTYTKIFSFCANLNIIHTCGLILLITSLFWQQVLNAIFFFGLSNHSDHTVHTTKLSMLYNQVRHQQTDIPFLHCLKCTILYVVWNSHCSSLKQACGKILCLSRCCCWSWALVSDKSLLDRFQEATWICCAASQTKRACMICMFPT